MSLEPTTSHLRDREDTRSMKTHAAKRIFEWTQFMLQWFVRFCRIYKMCSVLLERTFDSLLWSAMLLLTLLVSGIKSSGAMAAMYNRAQLPFLWFLVMVICLSWRLSQTQWCPVLSLSWMVEPCSHFSVFGNGY